MLGNRQHEDGNPATTSAIARILSGLGDRSLVLVGLMGVGKTCIGRRLARRLNLPFVDADDEIVMAAGCSIEELFERFGETVFRQGERRVIARLLDNGARVLATGGGAFVDADIRQRIRERGLSIWLRADLEILVRRTAGRTGRPLLKRGEPREILSNLMAARYPLYAQADITVDTGNEPPDHTVRRVIGALHGHFTRTGDPTRREHG